MKVHMKVQQNLQNLQQNLQDLFLFFAQQKKAVLKSFAKPKEDI